MRNILYNVVFFLGVFLFACCSSDKTVIVKFADMTSNSVIYPAIDSTILLNPGKGYIQYYASDSIYTKDYISIGYNRWCWSVVEPQEGQFNWKIIDDFIQEYKHYGKKVALAVMSVSTGIGMEYVTPKWVFDAGVSTLEIPDNTSPRGKQFITKNWDNPVFLKKMQNFIKAFGKRYDGNPDVAFLDIRDYGNWGEGHIGFLPGAILTSPEVLKTEYLQPYITAFPNTQLIMVWGSDKYTKVYDWGITQGLGIRRDGILSEWSKDGSECLRAFGHEPAVFEYCYGYEKTKETGYWSTELLMKYIMAGKPSYMQWDNKIFQENRDFCLKLGNKIGYHFVLQKVEVPSAIKANKPFTIQWQWLNDGIAPLYEPCHVAIALLDDKDQVVQKQWLTESNPKSWKPETITTEKLTTTFKSVPSGKYKLAVGLFLDQKDAKPAYRLGIQGRTSDGWYVLKE